MSDFYRYHILEIVSILKFSTFFLFVGVRLSTFLSISTAESFSNRHIALKKLDNEFFINRRLLTNFPLSAATENLNSAEWLPLESPQDSPLLVEPKYSNY